MEAIKTKSWADVPFGLSEAERAEYARLGNEVIGLALDSETIRDALAFEIIAPPANSLMVNGLFGVHGARFSGDKKYYLHAGYQSEGRANAKIPASEQPQVLKDFWKAHRQMLAHVETSMRRSLEALGASDLAEIMFPADTALRNIHIRTVRYLDATIGEVGSELVAAHGDLGVSTLHLFETHGGWFHAAPYSREDILRQGSSEWEQRIINMRSSMQPLDEIKDEVIFFLGAGWHTLPEEALNEAAKTLPACYHAGFRPSANKEIVSAYAKKASLGTNDRVAVIAFAHPNIKYSQEAGYVVPSFQQCRPMAKPKK